MDDVIKKTAYVLAIIGTLYHIYLVIHPYTPLSRYHISILSLTQVQRATHVFLICVLGYLMNFLSARPRRLTGGLLLAALTGLVLFNFLKLELAVYLKVFAVGIWGCAILSPMVPQTRKYSNLLCAILSFLPFV